MSRQLIVGDGNCLYRALAYTWLGDESRYEEIKNNIIDFLKNGSNKEHYQFLEGVDIEGNTIESKLKKYLKKLE